MHLLTVRAEVEMPLRARLERTSFDTTRFFLQLHFESRATADVTAVRTTFCLGVPFFVQRARVDLATPVRAAA